MALERFLAPFFVSILITFGLFWLMTALIHVEGELIEVEPVPTFDFVNLRLDPDPVVQETPPPTRPKIQQSPEPTPFDPSRSAPGLEGLIPHDPLPRNGASGPREGGGPLRPADGDAVPLVRVPPQYPETAIRRGVEGRVLVGFTISRSGSVEHARVLASEPSSIFDDAALKAIAQWRYEPKIVDGHPVEQPGLQIAIPFRLGNDAP